MWTLSALTVASTFCFFGVMVMTAGRKLLKTRELKNASVGVGIVCFMLAAATLALHVSFS